MVRTGLYGSGLYGMESSLWCALVYTVLVYTEWNRHYASHDIGMNWITYHILHYVYLTSSDYTALFKCYQ